jgi:DNA-binding NarL/FixJ family response regulator
MADPIDDLEQRLVSAVPQTAIQGLFAAIDQWRNDHGGNRAYIAKHSVDRRQKEILRMHSQGLRSRDIAERLGMSQKQIRRITSSRKSSYL